MHSLRLLPFLLLLFLTGAAAIGTQRDVPSHIAGLVAPIYLPGDNEPSGILRAGAINREFQRKMFFRIAILPTVSAQDVQFKCLHRESVSQTLSQMTEVLKVHSKDCPLNIHRASFILQGQTDPRLKAEEIQVGDDGRWRLTRVTWHTATTNIVALAGTLRISGSNAGELVLETSPQPFVLNLFRE